LSCPNTVTCLKTTLSSAILVFLKIWSCLAMEYHCDMLSQEVSINCNWAGWCSNNVLHIYLQVSHFEWVSAVIRISRRMKTKKNMNKKKKKKKECARPDIFTVMKIQVVVLWVVMLCTYAVG
jgi:hypothetical protein